MKQQEINMYSKTNDKIYKCEVEKAWVLNCFREDKEDTKRTSIDQGSLKDNIKNQNVSLFSDDLFTVFVALFEACLALFKDKNSYDASLHAFCFRSIINTQSLWDDFET